MEKQKKQLLVAAPGGKSYLVPFILITSLFLLWGFAHGLLDVLNKHFQGVFTMTKAESGLVQFSTYIAYFLMALPAGAFMKRYGYRKGIIMGLLLFAIGAFGFIPAAFLHSATPFLIALFVIACGLCILETAANPYSTILGPSASAAQRLNLSQSFNGLGWILGPLVGGLLIFGASEGDSMALTKPYILVGGIVLFVALLFFFTKLPEIKPEEEEEVTAIVEEKPAASLWKRRQFVRSVVAQFCYCAAQTGIFGFFINYVTEMDPGISNLRASRILAFGGIGGGFRRYAFAIRSLFILFLHVHHVPYDFRLGAGRYGRLYQESLFLYRDGSRRRRFQSDADGIYRRGEYGAGFHRPVDRFLVYLVFRYQM